MDPSNVLEEVKGKKKKQKKAYLLLYNQIPFSKIGIKNWDDKKP